MFEWLKKRGIVRIVPFDETYYLHVDLPSDTKLDEKLIELNYRHRSPYDNPCIIHCRRKERLCLWFTPQTCHAPVVIPESYLLYRYLVEQKQNILIVIDTHPRKILVIKNGELEAAFTTRDHDETMLRLTQEEFGIEELKKIGGEDYDYLRHEKLPRVVSLQDLIRFTRVSLDQKAFVEAFERRLAYPLIGLIAIYITVTYTQGYYLSREVQKLENQYRELKKKETPLKLKIREYNERIERYREFARKELIVPNPFLILADVYDKILPNDRAVLRYFTLQDLNLQIAMQVRNNPVLFLNRFNSIPYFKTVIIANSFGRTKKNRTVVYSIDLKTTTEALGVE